MLKYLKFIGKMTQIHESLILQSPPNFESQKFLITIRGDHKTKNINLNISNCNLVQYTIFGWIGSSQGVCE